LDRVNLGKAAPIKPGVRGKGAREVVHPRGNMKLGHFWTGSARVCTTTGMGTTLDPQLLGRFVENTSRRQPLPNYTRSVTFAPVPKEEKNRTRGLVVGRKRAKRAEKSEKKKCRGPPGANCRISKMTQRKDR